MIMTRAYGPHRDADAPSSVTIRTRTGEQTVPYPAALLAQRRAINSIAHTSQPIRQDNRAMMDKFTRDPARPDLHDPDCPRGSDDPLGTPCTCPELGCPCACHTTAAAPGDDCCDAAAS